MLVLTRKLDQSIRLELAGEIVWVTVLGIDRQVMLGIQASKSVKITREELLPAEEQTSPSRSKPRGKPGHGSPGG